MLIIKASFYEAWHKFRVSITEYQLSYDHELLRPLAQFLLLQLVLALRYLHCFSPLQRKKRIQWITMNCKVNWLDCGSKSS